MAGLAGAARPDQDQAGARLPNSGVKTVPRRERRIPAWNVESYSSTVLGKGSWRTPRRILGLSVRQMQPVQQVPDIGVAGVVLAELAGGLSKRRIGATVTRSSRRASWWTALFLPT